MNDPIAVVTGTIVGYDRANTTVKTIVRERTRSLFGRYVDEAQSIEHGTFAAQMKNPTDALRLCLEYRASLKQLTHQLHPKGLDARTSIGLGEQDANKAYESSSTVAVSRSSKGLDELMSRNGYLSVSTGSSEVDTIIGTTLRLLDRVVMSWSASQAAAMEYALQGMTQHQIADVLHITQPSVNNRLKLAHWNEIEHVINVWEGLSLQRDNVEYLY